MPMSISFRARYLLYPAVVTDRRIACSTDGAAISRLQPAHGYFRSMLRGEIFALRSRLLRLRRECPVVSQGRRVSPGREYRWKAIGPLL